MQSLCLKAQNGPGHPLTPLQLRALSHAHDGLSTSLRHLIIYCAVGSHGGFLHEPASDCATCCTSERSLSRWNARIDTHVRHACQRVVCTARGALAACCMLHKKCVLVLARDAPAFIRFFKMLSICGASSSGPLPPHLPHVRRQPS